MTSAVQYFDRALALDASDFEVLYYKGMIVAQQHGNDHQQQAQALAQAHTYFLEAQAALNTHMPHIRKLADQVQLEVQQAGL